MMRCRPALGTYVTIRACNEDLDESIPAQAEWAQAIDQAFAAVATVQACMSVFDPRSEISRLNTGEFFKRPGVIHPWLWDVLKLAKTIHRLSAAFDPCVGHRLAQQGLRPRHGRSDADSPGTLDDVWLLEGHCVMTTQALYLDLGGIAKGAAVDHAVDALRAHGVPAGCVNAGGDLRVFGPRAQAIHVRESGSSERLTYAGHLQDGAIATSGNHFAQGEEASPEGHLFNPTTQLPLRTPHTYSVLAAQCAVADALTKVYAITGDAHHPAIRHFNAQTIPLRRYAL